MIGLPPLPLENVFVGLQKIEKLDDAPFLIFRCIHFVFPCIGQISADPVGIERIILFGGKFSLQQERLKLRQRLMVGL